MNGLPLVKKTWLNSMKTSSIDHTIKFIRELYNINGILPLHAPYFDSDEINMVTDTIHSTFVSSVGKYVDQFEGLVQEYTQAGAAVATVNGTAALHAGLFLAGVKQGDLVISQSLTFVATCNAIHHLGAQPLFIDVSLSHLSLCPVSLDNYLTDHAQVTDNNECRHKLTGKIIRAMVPMHTFGHPADLDALVALAQKWCITLVEDAAESLGSFYKGKHTGTLGKYGCISFNGNKIITTGGGGMILCQTSSEGISAKHITTTAKQPHSFEFYHDEAAFNYRMPNLNAALGCAQMNKLNRFLVQKRAIANQYEFFFANTEYQFIKEPPECSSNYWLNAILLPDPAQKSTFLEQTNQAGVMTRPVWQLMHTLPMYSNSPKGPQSNAEWLSQRLINLPSSPQAKAKKYGC